MTTLVREEDGVELVVSRLNARDNVDVGPVPELVARLELDIEIKFDPSLGPVLRQVHVVSHDGYSSSAAEPGVYQRQTGLSSLIGKSATLGA